MFLGFLRSSAGKESNCNARDLGLILGLGRSPGEGKGYPLQYSGLENSVDRIVHGVTKNQTQLSNPSLHVTLHQTGPWCRCQCAIIDPQPLNAAYQLHWHLDPHLPDVLSSRPWNISVTWLFMCLTGPS